MMLGQFVFGATLSAIRRLRRNTRGAVAIEFSILAIPFFGLLIAIFETAMIFLGQQITEIATLDAARLIRTGQAQGFTQDQFRSALCANLSGMFKCGDIKIDVRTFPDFGSITNDVQALAQDEADGNNPLKFEAGGPSSIVMVRIYAILPALTSSFGLGLGNAPGGGHLIASTSIFRSEPYPTVGG